MRRSLKIIGIGAFIVVMWFVLAFEIAWLEKRMNDFKDSIVHQTIEGMKHAQQ